MSTTTVVDPAAQRSRGTGRRLAREPVVVDAPPRRASGGRTPTRRRDDWPHTTRVMPWMLAGFLVLIWLVPINSISLTVNLPFELRLDRILLPVIGLIWLLMIWCRGRDAPKIELTWVHFAVGLFIAIAFLSDVLNARYLNQTLAFSEALKKLVLLLSWGALFLIMSSSIRRSEVRAFITFTFALSVICGIGVIYEYRFKTNLFYQWSATLLPHIFQVPDVNAAAVDDIGRRLVVGPAQTGLETAAMLSMALPIGLIRFTEARGRKRLLYLIGTAIVLAATISTYKKTAFVAPVVVFAVLAGFRPRALVKLLPALIVLLAFVHVLAPGSFGSIEQQLVGGQLTSVGTTAHRTIAYDAVRPDVWSHPLIGAGYGSYDQVRVRILDTTVLDLLIGVGALGVLAFLAMPICAMIVAAPLIRRGTRRHSGHALAIAATAAVFLVVSFLYDSIAYPHVPYIFMAAAALLAVLVSTKPEPGENDAPAPGPADRKRWTAARAA
jgi:hypothetical protein